MDLQGLAKFELSEHFGKFGEVLYYYSRGEDDRPVETEWERKSVGTEETFEKDIDQFDEMKDHISRMVLELKETLTKYEDRVVKNLHVKIKYHDFKQTTIERQIPVEVENFVSLLEERWCQDPRPVRLLGVGVKFEGSEEPSSSGQLPLLNLV